ncbi:hypothetical protein [Natronorubrum aibiense]|uniref:Uncharacterized protein n=1 Tax=Natronorubrum aibiense TaxID=348826 RepID=A0A5P9P222_9EURY|nr:hypothetical protein [Natronorubrum aibiense]QFU82179.1 hypothetical protein GCU68_06360 [Natronorubrum aibiense]
MTPSRRTQEYDLTITAGTGLALAAYVALGGLLAFGLGCLTVALGLYRYVPEDEHVLQGLLGLLAVLLGGMAPPSVLIGTPFGYWLVDDNPLPLALGIAVLVVVFVLILRRFLPMLVTSSDAVDPSS